MCYNKYIEVSYFGIYIQPEKSGVLAICVKKK